MQPLKTLLSSNRLLRWFLTVRNIVFHLVYELLETKYTPIIVAAIIYILSMILTAPTRHGGDRHYLLALDIIENHSINIQRLIDQNNHYALVSADLFKFKGKTYNNLNPGQALLGLPGLWVYRFIRHVNNVSSGISVTGNAIDKIDFVLGTFAMNLTSSALLIAIASLFFAYFVTEAFPARRMKLFSVSVFILMFYLSTPLFYYSTHIIQNESEGCLVFISLGLLCLSAFNSHNPKVHIYFLVTGGFIGLAFLTNSSSIILLPFGVMHVFLAGFASLDFKNLMTLIRSLRVELYLNRKQKTIYLAFLCLGFLLPTVILLYYQYKIFSNPLIPVQSFLSGISATFSPTWKDYLWAFGRDLLETLFSTKVGLFSYTPILVFPFLIWIAAGSEMRHTNELEVNLYLRKMLFRTMILILPLYIIFYSLAGAKGFAEWGWKIEQYNLYSARHILPIVLPLGYLLFDSLLMISTFKPIMRWSLWSLLLILWLFSLATNVASTLIGDWIFSLNQVWSYIYYLFIYGYRGFINQGRSLIDW